MHKAMGIKRASVRTLQTMAAQIGQIAEDTEEEEDSEVDSDEDDNAVASNGRVNGHSKKLRQKADAMDVDLATEQQAMESDDEQPQEDQDPELDPRTARQTERIIPADEVRAHLRLLFHHEREIVNLLYAPHGPLSHSGGKGSADIFFMDVVAVPPARFRPAATMGDQVFENPQNALLNGILRQTFAVRDLNASLLVALAKPQDDQAMAIDGPANGAPLDPQRLYVQLLESLIGLQVAVNSMMDSSKNPMVVGQGKLPPQGVKQLLEKKEGLFRKNMMVSVARVFRLDRS